MIDPLLLFICTNRINSTTYFYRALRLAMVFSHVSIHCNNGKDNAVEIKHKRGVLHWHGAAVTGCIWLSFYRDPPHHSFPNQLYAAGYSLTQATRSSRIGRLLWYVAHDVRDSPELSVLYIEFQSTFTVCSITCGGFAIIFAKRTEISNAPPRIIAPPTRCIAIQPRKRSSTMLMSIAQIVR